MSFVRWFVLVSFLYCVYFLFAIADLRATVAIAIAGRAISTEKEMKERRKVIIYIKKNKIKGDSFTRSNRENPNIAIVILEKNING